MNRLTTKKPCGGHSTEATFDELFKKTVYYEDLEEAGRILPQGFSCVKSSGGKNLLMFHPKDRGITHDVNHEYAHNLVTAKTGGSTNESRST